MVLMSIFPLIVLASSALAHGPHGPPAKAPCGRNASEIRMNQIQVIGTHNSYHREISLAERAIFEKYVPSPENYYYSQATFENQLSHQSVRSLEIDLHSDTVGGLYAQPLIWKLSNLTNATIPFHDANMTKPGIKVFHITDLDTNSICHTFTECLWQLKGWSDAHPRHLPILIDLELKTDAAACGAGGVCAEEAKNWTLSRLLNVDAEIRSVLPKSQVIIPDDIRQGNLTLEQSILQHGWLTLGQARGKFMFYFDNEPDVTNPSSPRNLYRSDGHESLEGRTVFTNSVEGDADAAFIKYNSPTNTTDIQRLVRKGYILRTRADEPIVTVLNHDTTMRELAFASSAQIVSTDYPVYGMSSRWDWDYAVQLPDAAVGRCNPISAPEWCNDAWIK
ncbi:hypothetical protein B0A48_16814 [Cryoendolithus antarcticus]|uniref:Phosphatidylinositol-specific phospholipase C X domain-containing protein n=1 Tax=Cryoendolithus antarcticus TaxID=1507870 RepID=A0A1V8SDP4_9PEZI|nr:hypothetical protein B0A48_16814 [Cryoendolithus antarcticus]